MKLKTSAIAMAVAGTLATPMVAQADLYASARIGINNVDTGGVSELSVAGVSSRFGMKQEFDLGNGMTSYGKYEFSVATEGTGPTLGRRHAVVGLKGDFGNVYLGQTNHEFFNHLVGPLDNPWVGSGIAMVDYLSRDPQQISYATSFGAVAVGLSAVMATNATATNGQDGLDGFELAVSVPAGDLGTIAVGIRDLDGPTGGVDPDALIGITWHGIMMGDATFGIGYQAQEDDTSIVLDVGINGFYGHYETLDCDAAAPPAGSSGSPNCGGAGFARNTSPSVIALGYTQPLGRNTSMWYEVHSVDADTPVSNDDLTGLYATLKVDIE